MFERNRFPSSKQPYRSQVQIALENELILLEAALHQYLRALADFEDSYGLSMEEIVKKMENEELDETQLLKGWMAEYRFMQTLRERVERLRSKIEEG
jgi:hypothetical protein